MEIIDLKISNVARTGYDPETKVLRVWFKNGGLYEYYDVPPEVFDNVKALHARNDSVGSFLHKSVKPKYKFAKIEEDKS